MSSGVDSKAVFAERLMALQVSDFVKQQLIGQGLDTMNAFAFCCAFQPGQPDETPFLTLLGTVLTRAPTIAEASQMRRLFYESHALVIVNMRSQIDRPSDKTPRRMMPAERHSRHEQQQKRLGSA